MADGETLSTYAFAGMIGQYPEVQEPVAEPDPGPEHGPIFVNVGTPTRFVWDFLRYTESPSAEAQKAWCGADAVEQGLGTGFTSPDSPVTSTATGFIENGELVLQHTMTNVGPTEVYGTLRNPTATVVRDGRIIARAFYEGDHAIAEWSTGATVELDFSVGPHTCTYMYGEDWPAGTYELYLDSSLIMPAGPRADLLPPLYFHSSGPWAFTIE